jgi:hypothetical protein
MRETPFGSIKLTVTDEKNAVILNATVLCENTATGTLATRITDNDGYCLFQKLEAGSYKLTVNARNFKELVHSKIEVVAAKATTLSVKLEPGSASEQVIVTAEAGTYVENNSTALETAFNGQELRELPISGRNPIAFALLAAGVTQTDMPANGLGIHVNGNRASSNNYLVDGTDVSDSYRNSPAGSEPTIPGTSPTGFPVDAVHEFRVSGDFDVDAGRNSGATMDLTLKSGTNKVSGSFFEYLKNDALNARDFFNFVGSKNKLRYHNFGLSLGGPFKRDKAFWFGAYDGLRERKESTAISAVPTNGDFAQAITALGGNPAITPEQNPVVNPVIRNLFALCRSSAQCPGGMDLWPGPTPERTGLVLNSFARAPGRNRSNNLVVKLKIALNSRNDLSGYYSLNRSNQSLPLAQAGGGDLPRTNTVILSRSQVVSVSYGAILSNYISNELRIGWNRYEKQFLDEDEIQVRDPAQTIGLNTEVTNPRDFGLPHLVVQSFEPLGASPFSNPRRWLGTNWHVSERLNLITGRHGVKLGYEFRRASIASFNDVDFRGRLEFASLQDFLAGRVASGSLLKGNSDRTTIQGSHLVYVQDSFRKTPRLTLNSGLRWEYFGTLREKDMLLSYYDPSRGLVAPKNLYEADSNNFSPRLGFAWDVTGKQKTVLRAGGGVYFDPFPQDFFIGQIQFNSFNAGVAYNPLAERPILNSSSPIRVLQVGQPVFPAATFSSDTRDAWTIDKIRTPYVLNYNLNLQQELFANTILQIAYVGSSGRKLFRARDVNAPQVPGETRPFDNAAALSSVATKRPFIVNQIETSATSNYNSLQVSLQQRQWHHLTNVIQWTWSHSIDDASDGVDTVPNKTSPDNPHMPHRERANSNFDMRHRVTWAMTYELPSSIKRAAISKGWQIAGILTIQSGQPYSVNFGREFDSQSAYDFILRPDVVGNPLLGTSSPDRLLNLAAFKVPCTLDGLGTDVSHCLPGTLHFGILPRNAFLGPKFKNFDFSLSKTMDFRERFRLQLKAEFFNLTNHPNFSSPLAPRFIARAGLKGISANGQGGARGTACNTGAASVDCYLPTTRTTGPRTIRFSARFFF